MIKCPDPGAYWYHPHIRSDYGIEMGLYGGIVVEPADHDYWPPVHRELFLTLDDLLLEEGQVAPFSREETTHAAMGRFGNVLLVNGETDLALTAHRGEVLRLYLLNTANTRVFNVGLPGARVKLVGGDSGHVEQEEWVEEVVIAPSERFVVDVTFDAAGEFALQHRTPDRVYPLAAVTVQEEPAEPSLAETFAQLRSSPDMVDERARIRPYLEAPPDETPFLPRRDEPAGAQGRRSCGNMSDGAAHVILKTLDMAGTIRWYTTAGFKLRDRFPAIEPQWCEVERDDLVLQFLSGETPWPETPVMTGCLADIHRA